MINFNNFLYRNIKHRSKCLLPFAFCLEQRGAMMTELLLSIALAAAMLPFILRSERTQELRTKNIAAAEQLSNVKSALENYMDAHKKELLTPIGRNITRVKISDLDGFGVSAEILENHPDDFQMRILKSPDRGGKPTLQGLVIMTGADITPLRTREIATLSGNAAGFIDNGKAFGAFGTWRAGAGDFGGGLKDGVLETTTVKRGEAEYLWRLPSENAADATLASNMNMGGHDLIGAKFLDSSAFRMEEYLNANTVVSDKLIFQNRTTLENNFAAADASVNGALSSDSKNMEISGGLTLLDTGKFSSITAEELWTGTLRLSGLSVSNATLKVNQSMNMTAGRVNAMFATVGFAGSITPRLVVSGRLEDAADSKYFWDFQTNNANFNDASLANLGQMASAAVYQESGSGTESGRIFGSVAANKNATAADFMNAVSDIALRVRAKYQQLNLE